jgi:CheY-like chemotaxis protein/nitrogen-specific signal transduction histidine kinase
MQEKLVEIAEACGLANAELARAAHLSDQFLANMSHELRTPMNTILGMSQALQEGVMGPVNDDQMSYLLMVEKAGRHLLGMLTDILTLSKAGAGRLEVHPERIATQSVCHECLQFILQPGRQKHIKMECQCDPRAAMIEADENILKQILVNLLTNAVKFTGERGAINLTVACHPEREAVSFVVSDTGCGIAREHMDRLFQPFVQLNEGLARPYPGNGLGLSLIYKLTELHGGSVAVESEEGHGTRFTILLPWHANDAEAESVPSPAPAPGPRLLLVEDNQRTIKSIQQRLASAGYAVTLACQGAEALERVAQEKPPLVLVDLQLAGMTGWAFIKHIRANPRLHQVSIVALTAMIIPGDRERCLETGADAYFEKPVSGQVLLATVAELLARKTGNHQAGRAPAPDLEVKK